MKEIAQQKLWMHNRGIEILMPPHAKTTPEQGEVSARESQRLYQIHQDGTLKKRYPTPEKGQEFMEIVDFDRRETLLSKAAEASSTIVDAWQQINPDKDIAVVLFGSVAKGTVKECQDPDPSNIDMAVIGDFTCEEQEALYDSIRPYREQVKQELLESCGELASSEANPGNLGVNIQQTQKLTNGHYSGMVSYIGSAAFPLHDPTNIWETLEQDALDRLSEERSVKMKKEKTKIPKMWKDEKRKIIEGSHKNKERSSLPQEGDIFVQPRLF